MASEGRASSNQRTGERTMPNYTHEQLLAAFSLVEDSSDWRAPIDYTGKLSDTLLTQVCEAIRYFTATEPTVMVRHNKPGAYRIVADGYRMGPAGS